MAAVLVGVAWYGPSPDYLYVPNKATPVASKVTVEGEKRRADGPGALYFVDVSIRRASWAKLAFTRPDGSTLVPHEQVVPPEVLVEASAEDGLREMARSEKVAAAVALKRAGYKVKTSNKGALIETVASDAPAASKLDSGDVIVAARGKPVLTPGQLRAAFNGVHPGDDVVLRVRRAGQLKTVTVRTVESSRGEGPRDRRDHRRPGGRHQAAGQGRHQPRSGRGPSAGLPFALDVLQELGTNVDRGLKVVATGEMELDGTVGPIGGVKQKTYGARKAGAMPSSRLGITQPRHAAMQGTFASSPS